MSNEKFSKFNHCLTSAHHTGNKRFHSDLKLVDVSWVNPNPFEQKPDDWSDLCQLCWFL